MVTRALAGEKGKKAKKGSAKKGSEPFSGWGKGVKGGKGVRALYPPEKGSEPFSG